MKEINEPRKIALVLSDLDDTFEIHSDESITQDNITAAKHFRQAGGLFGLVSGRPHFYLANKASELGISFDFAVTSNGAEVFRGDQLVYQNLIPEAVAAEIVTSLKTLGVTPYSHFEQGLLENDVQSDTSIIFVWDDDDPLLKALETEYSAKYPDLYIVSDGGALMFMGHGVSKSKGIKQLLQTINCSSDKVLVIGNGYNDIGMIVDYNGYAVAGSVPELLAATPNHCESVGQLLRSFPIAETK